MSWFLTVLAWTTAAIIYLYVPRMWFFAQLFLFLSLMELFQALSYPLLDQCDNPWNKLLTLLSFLHICTQPTVLNLFAANEYKYNPVYYQRYLYACRLSALFGAWFFLRGAVEIVGFTKSVVPDECFAYTKDMLQGRDLCTYRGNVHLGWSVPLADSYYFWPSTHMHGFFMYCTMMVQPEEPSMFFKGLSMMLLGPVLGLLITPDPSEAGAIWCFQSIGHMFIGALAHFFLVEGGRFGDKEKKIKEK